MHLDVAFPSVDLLRARTAETLVRQHPRFASRVAFDNDEENHDASSWSSFVRRHFFRRYVVFYPLSLEEIDMDYHFQVVDGKGTFDDNNVSDLVSDAHLLDWDRSKPLFRIILVFNMKGGRSMLFAIVDHTVGDGASMAATLLSLFDKEDTNNKNKGREKGSYQDEDKSSTATATSASSQTKEQPPPEHVDGLGRYFPPPPTAKTTLSSPCQFWLRRLPGNHGIGSTPTRSQQLLQVSHALEAKDAHGTKM